MSQPNRSWKRSRAQSGSPCQRHVGVGGALTPTPTAYRAFSFHKAAKAIGSNSQQPKGGSNPRAHRQGGGQTGRGAHAQGRSSARPSERGSSDARCPAARQRAAPRGPRGGHARTDGECGGCRGPAARTSCSRGTGFQLVETERLAAQWRACRTVRLVLPA